MTTERDRLLEIREQAKETFFRGVRHDRNPSWFVQVPGFVTDGSLASTESFLVDPVAYLAGTCPRGDLMNFTLPPEAPFVVCVVGRAGQGKTLLLQEILAVSDRSQQLSTDCPIPFPVNLASRRAQMNDLPVNPDGESMSDLLLGSFASERGIERDAIVRAIAAGCLTLLIDSLDEAITRSDQIPRFFQGLRRFLEIAIIGVEKPRFRIVIASRMELFEQLGSQSILTKLLEPFRSSIQNEVNAAVRILHLEGLDDQRVKLFFERRLGDRGNDLWNRLNQLQSLRESHDLVVALHNPLLLSILCTLASDGTTDMDQLFNSVRFSYDLVQSFIGSALQGICVDGIKCSIDPDVLAEAALEVYRDPHYDISLKSMRDAVMLCEDYSPEQSLIDDTRDRILHFCPILVRQGNDKKSTFGFTHHLFFDHFVAKGVMLGERKGVENSTLRPFDDLVLRVGMRRILRWETLKCNLDWRERTKESYALNQKQTSEWDKMLEASLGELENIRYCLLESSYDPEIKLQKVIESTEQFLKFDECKDYRLHPRYLLYVYNDIAQWLGRPHPPQTKITVRQIRKRFHERLKYQFDVVWKELGERNKSNILPNLPSCSDSQLYPEELLLDGVIQQAIYSNADWLGQAMIKITRASLANRVKTEATRNRIESQVRWVLPGHYSRAFHDPNSENP